MEILNCMTFTSCKNSTQEGLYKRCPRLCIFRCRDLLMRWLFEWHPNWFFLSITTGYRLMQEKQGRLRIFKLFRVKDC